MTGAPKKSQLARAGGVVGVVVGALSIPGAGAVLDGVWEWLVENLLTVGWFTIAVALLVGGFWDAILGFLGIRTKGMVDRRVRNWLHEEQYTITPRRVEGAGFTYDVHSPHDQALVITVQQRDDVPGTGVLITTGRKFGGDHRDPMEGASDSEWLRLRIELTRLALMGKAASVTMRGGNDPAQFSVEYQACVLTRSLSQVAFFEAIHLVRLCVVLADLVMSELAESHRRGGESDTPPATQAQPKRPPRRKAGGRR